MNVLIVGAGAIGQVFGFHLAQGGARVSYLVRKSHALPSSRAFHLDRLRRWGRPRTDAFRPHRFFTSLDELRAEQWAQVWLCVPSPSLETDWVTSLVAATGDATLVFLPAGLEVVDRLAPPKERTVVGLISLMSRSSGLGVSYWLPPMVTLVLEGPEQRRAAAVKLLRRGGCAAVSGDARRAGAFGSAVLIPHVVALEAAGWSYRALAQGPWLTDSLAATREASAVAAAQLGTRQPLGPRLLRPWVLRLALWLARWAVPFSLEEFFQAHFTKVRRQSEAQLREYIALGKRAGQPTPAIERLVHQVFEVERGA
jgi:2-dehydropantoate 2-reductase